MREVAYFTAGLAIGSILTTVIFKKLQQLDEQESVAEEETKKEEKPEPKIEVPDKTEELLKTMANKYEDIASQYSNEKPKIIKINDYDELDASYTKKSLTYYDDGVLADDADDIPVDDVEGTVGLKNLSKISDSYEKDGMDVIYILNESMHEAYEITRDLRTYSDVVGEEDYEDY